MLSPEFRTTKFSDKIVVSWMVRGYILVDPGSVYWLEFDIVAQLSSPSEKAREWREEGKLLAFVDLEQDKGEVLEGFEEKFMVGIADGSLRWMFFSDSNFIARNPLSDNPDSRAIIASPEFGPMGGYINVRIMKPEQELPELRLGQKRFFAEGDCVAVLWHDPELELEWGLIMGEVKPGFEEKLLNAANKVGGMRNFYALLE